MLDSTQMAVSACVHVHLLFLSFWFWYSVWADMHDRIKTNKRDEKWKRQTKWVTGGIPTSHRSRNKAEFEKKNKKKSEHMRDCTRTSSGGKRETMNIHVQFNCFVSNIQEIRNVYVNT